MEDRKKNEEQRTISNVRRELQGRVLHFILINNYDIDRDTAKKQNLCQIIMTTNAFTILCYNK